MPSSLALRRAASSALFNRLVHPIRAVSAAPATRYFTTNTQMTTYDDDDRSVDVDRRSVSRRRDAFPTFFSDAFDPFSPPRSVNQLLNQMDQFMENPFRAASRGMRAGIAARLGWHVREDDNALYLRIDIPGFDKENVKVSLEHNTLCIKAEGGKESEEDEEYGRRSYSSRVNIPPNLYKIDGIKAELKNGVLKVVVPKVKEEERKDVYHVKIE